jgi:multidrug efflux system outer membrane protein
MMKTTLPLTLALALGACATLEPSYDRPALPTPDSWPQGAAYTQGAASEAALPDWQSFYGDDNLRQLIAIALENNRDLRIAALNIERARSTYRIQRAQSVPSINAGASAQSGETPIAAGGAGETTRLFSAEASITAFELDLFGRVRSLNNAALQRYFATEAGRDSVQISLIAEVATVYVTYAGDLELLRLAQETLQSQRASLDLTQRRLEAGASSQLDVHRAQTTVETARADVARYTALTAQDENALALLLGAPVPATLRPTNIDAIAFGAADLPPALPSQVLLNRPDIIGAEHELRASNANIGAARAAFFPSISLSGSAGQIDPSFESLFAGAGDSWSFTPRITIPIFSGGANIARLDGARTDRDIAVAQYERSIQVAFREVADALAERGTIGEQVSAREALVQAASGSYDISEARYHEGIDSYLGLLDAQRQLYAAQQQLVAARVARAANFVTLYRTLGGGA